MCQYRLGADVLEISSAHKDQCVLMDSWLTVNQQCDLVAKRANDTLGALKRVRSAGRGKWFFHAAPVPLVRPHFEYSVQFRAP